MSKRSQFLKEAIAKAERVLVDLTCEFVVVTQVGDEIEAAIKDTESRLEMMREEYAAETAKVRWRK